MGRYVLWTAKTSDAMDEQVLTSSDDPKSPKFAAARKWAEAKGYTHFRFADTDRADFDARCLAK